METQHPIDPLAYNAHITDLIKHENDLRNNRMSWFCAIEVTLLGGFLAMDERLAPHIHWIAAMGIAIVIGFGTTFLFGDLGQRRLRKIWMAYCDRNHLNRDDFPPVIAWCHDDANPIYRCLIWLAPWRLCPILALVAWLFILIQPFLQL